MSKPDYDTDHEVLWTGKDVAKVCRTTPEMVARCPLTNNVYF